MNSAGDTDSTTDTSKKFDYNCVPRTCMKNDVTWQEKEKRRLSNILEYNLENFDIDDKGLQAITKLAAIICGTSMSFVTLVGSEYVRFLSKVGAPSTGTVRLNSFCTIAIEQDEFFEIEDSTKDPRFDENEFVKGQENPLKYYGGYPIVSKQGYKFGSLCVCDLKAHKLNEMQREALKTLSEEVMVHLELRKNNIELKAANELAEKLARVKDDFVNNVSHELRTPLNAIGGYTEILSKTELDSDQKEAVGIIKGSCEILIVLINDILDFSKIQLGKLQLENIAFDLRKTVKNVKDLLNPKAKEKNLKFELRVDEKIPKFILGDKVRINQIIMNLTGNALKFTQEGQVKIDVKQIGETDKTLNILFSVKDSGIGIQEDKLHTIFERFEQAGKDITRKFGGTGLGLNISKNLVELHNSKLELKSVFGKGTEFFFTIEFDKFIDEDVDKINYQNAANNENYMEKISNIKNLKLLVCEDNSVNIKLIKAIFKNKNINIEIAENGKIAIDMLKKRNHFHLILMDLQMPEMNGFETTKYIRNIMNLNIPIIGFSASTSEIEKNYCFQIGMNDYFLKSFGGTEIFDKLNNFVNTNKIYVEDIETEEVENKLNSSIRENKCPLNPNNNFNKLSNSFKMKKSFISKASLKEIKKSQNLANNQNHLNNNINPILFKNKKDNEDNIIFKGIGLLGKGKNYSNCEVKSKMKIESVSYSIDKINSKDSEGHKNKSNEGFNNSNIHRSINSQAIRHPKIFNINNSDEKNKTLSNENSEYNKINTNILINSKNSSSYEKQSKLNDDYFDTNFAINDGYNSNTEYDFVKSSFKNKNYSFSKNKFSLNLLNDKNHQENEEIIKKPDLSKSFNFETKTEKNNYYMKKFIRSEKSKSKTIINNNPNNIYKFSKFNENTNLNTNNNKSTGNYNNSKCSSDKNYQQNNILNSVDRFSDSNSNLHVFLEDENIDEKEIMLKEKIQDPKFFENNFEIISNKSKSSEKIYNLENSKKVEEENKIGTIETFTKREKFPDEKENFNKQRNENSKSPQKKGEEAKEDFSRKSSFTKLNMKNLKDDESLEFSQVSIKFENFNNSEEENDDLLNLENANKIDDFEEDLEMRNELMEIFMDENPKQMKSLKTAIIGRNLEAIKFVAHTMKPSILMFGLKKLYKKLEKIEIICKSISLNKIKALYEDIKRGLEVFYNENKKQ